MALNELGVLERVMRGSFVVRKYKFRVSETMPRAIVVPALSVTQQEDASKWLV
jgi:hypothetical protein